MKIKSIVDETELRRIPLLLLASHFLCIPDDKMDNVFSTRQLQEVGFLINNVIDFEQSAQEERLVVKEGVDDELDELKRKYCGLDDFLASWNT